MQQNDEAYRAIEQQIHEDTHAALELLSGSERLIRWFHFMHLPEPLRNISQPFAELAGRLCTMVPASAERTAALRKILEAKDCAVRAAMERDGVAPFTTMAPRETGS